MSDPSDNPTTPGYFQIAAETNTLLRIAQANQEVRVSAMERAIGKISDTLDKLSSIDTLLSEMRKIDIDHETRIRMVEEEMPVLKLVKGWVIAGVACVFAIAVKMYFPQLPI